MTLPCLTTSCRAHCLPVSKNTVSANFTHIVLKLQCHDHAFRADILPLRSPPSLVPIPCSFPACPSMSPHVPPCPCTSFLVPACPPTFPHAPACPATIPAPNYDSAPSPVPLPSPILRPYADLVYLLLFVDLRSLPVAVRSIPLLLPLASRPLGSASIQSLFIYISCMLHYCPSALIST